MPEQKLLSLDSMNFSKTATALALVAMALTSCKAPESASSESTPPAQETISVATACEKIKPIVGQAGELFASPGPDFIEKIKPLLDDIDGIANSVETEEGRATILDMTQAWDKFIAAIEAGDGANDSGKSALVEISKTTDSLGAYCEKASL